jgi:hypothetical protein
MPSTTTPLDDLELLTQRYARYSGHLAGLPAVWGGLIISLMGGLNLGWFLGVFLQNGGGTFKAFVRFLGKAALAPRPVAFQLGCFLLPLLWALGRIVFQRRYYEAWGRVRSREATAERIAMRWVMTGAAWLECVGLTILFWLRPGPSRWLALAVILLLVHALQTPKFDSFLDHPTSTLITLLGVFGVLPLPAIAVTLMSLIYLPLGWLLMGLGGFFLLRFTLARRHLLQWQQRQGAALTGHQP